MKSQFKGFLAGALVSALVLGLSVSALAFTGHMTIEVSPINVQVNGNIFEPTDVNGTPVPVFNYNGTTYAPVRALAEAYGLQVSWDAKNNMASVWAPGMKPVTPQEDSPQEYNFDYSYEEFEKLWHTKEGSDDGNTLYFYANNEQEVLTWWAGAPEEQAKDYVRQITSGRNHIRYEFRTEGTERVSLATYYPTDDYFSTFFKQR